MQQVDTSRVFQLREDYREVGRDLVKLLRFVDMNATGLRKILKKFDKRFGYKFTDYYVTTRSNHPYSQLQQVFKQVQLISISATYHALLLIQGDPIIDQVNHAVQKLTHATSFMQYLGQHALIVQDDTPSGSEDNVDDESYHFMSLMLNLVNTFLYMVNTYIIVPTADDYSVSLGAAATVCGIIIGSMAVAQVFSSVYFSAWSNRSYFRPLVFSSIMLFSGNLLYALAYDLNSLTVLLIGRILCGLGSARAVNRRYISDCVPLKIRLQASAGFVSASALGMACGPGLAGFLQTKFTIYSLTFNQSTLPGWVMSIAWLLYLVWLWFSFKEPEHFAKAAAEAAARTSQPSESGHQESANLEEGLAQPLLLGSEERLDDNSEDNDDEDAKSSHEPATSFASAYKLLTPSVKVQLLIYFMLKYAMEILLSESSVVTTYYFNWDTSAVAIFLAILGLTVLPVNAIVGSYVTNWFEDR
uniref:SPX domain-containing protein n=1 Tax=Aegilops tauschii subsp. strangulata TaxID=200361 RepID=A0A453CLC7_AEGTS